MIKKIILITSIIIVGVCFTLIAYEEGYIAMYKKRKDMEPKKPKQEDYSVYIDTTYIKYPSERYLTLLKEYNKRHYDKDNALLTSPSVIVVHTSACKTLSVLVATLKADTLGDRSDIEKGGNVNVGVHFMIDHDGKIYQSLPLEYTGRHTIGLNYTAIGIENVGLSEKDYTEEQIEANIKLIRMLTNKYKTIKYVIGHYEYNNTNMPHYELLKEMDKKYRFPKRSDPGINIMRRIRGY